MSVLRPVALAGVAGIVALMAAGGPALSETAAHDTEPPALSTPIKARFIVGAKLAQFRDNDEHHAFYDMPLRLSWSATDNRDASLNFDVWEHPQAEAPIRRGDYITATEFDVEGSDYDGFFGGASLVVDHWSVQAYDNAGNSVDRAIYGAHVLVTQDNGRQSYGSATQQVRVRYSDGWSAGTCSCFADRTVRRSSERGAALVVRVRVPDREDVRRVALVFDRGPLQGAVHLTIDGRAGPRIDLSAAKAVHRTIVWAGTFEAGVHVIRAVNQSPAGLPRVAFDAVLVN